MIRLAPLVPLLILVILFVCLQPVPAEDACILFRYATHLAGGHGIVWNVGEPPVEGATEFVWMVLIAGMIRLGLPAEMAAQTLGLVFSGAGAVLLYRASRWIFHTGLLPALAVSCAYAASTTVLHAGTGFATPLYTLIVMSSFLLTWRLLTEETPPPALEWLFPLTILLAGLTRPEGNLFGGLLYAGILVVRPRLFTSRFVRSQILMLVLPGIIYFGWRYWYFGYLFPNTYYVKLSRELITMQSAERISRFALRFCLVPVAIIGFWTTRLRSPDRKPIVILTVIPLIYMGIYLRFAMIQDVGFRFLFPAFGALLIFAAPALCALPSRLLRAGVGAVLVAASAWMIRASGPTGVYDDRHEIGTRLAAYAPHGHVMMPTEAGYLPFQSEWTAVDPFGLNDVTIAHEGLTPAYIASRSPDLIMFHVDTGEYRERWAPIGADRWEAMTKMLYGYARDHGYRLVAVIQKSERVSEGYHWYYLKPGMTDEEPVAAAILEVAGARARAPDQPSASLYHTDPGR